MTKEAPAVELAISELRRDLDVGMANVEGQLALLHQLHAHQERNADAHSQLLNELEERLANAEREQVTREHLDTRFRHLVAVLGLVVTAASVAVSALLSVLGK
jgi:hypothetical protein